MFADLAGRLHDRIELLWQRASGIEILEDPAPAADGQSSVCQICDSEIDKSRRTSFATAAMQARSR